MSLHPSILGVLRWFEYEHLPPHLQPVSAEFAQVAHLMTAPDGLGLEGPEVTRGLVKLLEAKDEFVRALVAQANP